MKRINPLLFAVCGSVLCVSEVEAGWKTMFTKVPVVPRPREIVEKSGVYVVPAGRTFPGDVTWRTDASVRSEGYRLAVATNGIVVTAGDDAGRFYALQTLRQLATKVGDTQVIPCIEIDDWPAFGWRGVHLDECRHFFGKETVKTVLDLMSFHNENEEICWQGPFAVGGDMCLCRHGRIGIGDGSHGRPS